MLSQSSLISSSNVFLTCSTQTLFEKRHSDLCQSSNAFWRKPAFWFSGELDLNSLQNDQDFPDTTKRISCNLESSFVTIFSNQDSSTGNLKLWSLLHQHQFEKKSDFSLFWKGSSDLPVSTHDSSNWSIFVWTKHTAFSKSEFAANWGSNLLEVQPLPDP